MRAFKSAGTGFVQAFLVNLLLQFEWLLVALVLLVLHCWLDVSITLFLAALGFWVLLSLVVTWFVTWASGCRDVLPGAGSMKTSERLKAREE